MSDLSSGDLIAIERIEVEACRSSIAVAPDATTRELGIGSRTLRSGVAIRASRMDILAYNRILGLGLETAARAADLDEAIDFYRAAAAPRIMANLAPIASAGVQGWLEERGFYLHNHWIRLWRNGGQAVEAAPDPRVRPIGREHAEAFARTDVEAFRFPEAMVPWIAAIVGRPGWRHWAAFDGQEPVGFGALFVKGDVGWLGFASTRPSHRGTGIQSAIIATRLRAAAELGCRLLSVETADDTPEKPNPSTHNLVRMGFRPAFKRPNWVLKLAPDAAAALGAAPS
jgi:GNAT superfamily N-acetyltransferase